jgi:ceramide glucosyltransferase
MLWAVNCFFVAGALLLLQSVWSLLDGIRFLRSLRKWRRSPPGTHTPTAAIVIPCKGVDAGFNENIECFLNQDYPDYEIVFAVATGEDDAYSHLFERVKTRKDSGATRNPRMSLIVAGIAEGRGEKVNNLLRAVQAVDEGAKVYVFADIDAAPAPDWLRSLVAPLANAEITVSTGFRWYLPGQGFASRLRAAWDTSIATMMGDHSHNFAWGGSMAIRAEDFHRLGVAERYWANTVSDDYAVTRAVREAGGKITFVPRCLVASREESSLGEFLRWSTRQIILTRVYAAPVWRLGLASSILYSATLIWGLVVLTLPRAATSQRLAVAVTLGIILLLGMGKGYIRSIVAREVFAVEPGSRASCYWQFVPVIPWIMLWNFVAAGLTRRIEWRGTEYELLSPDKVRVTRRRIG